MDLENILSQQVVFTISGLLLFLYALSSILRRRRSHAAAAARKAPPEAGGAWPLIGHLHLLGGSQPPHVTLGNIADKYGPVFTIRLGVHQTLVVSSSEVAKECFTVNDKAFANRPKSIAFEVLGYDFAMMGFTSYGPYWRHVRKISTLGVLSTHRIDTLKHVMESEVKTAIKERYNYWLQQVKNGSGDAVTEMKKWFEDIILNVLFRVVVGKRFVGAGSDKATCLSLILAGIDTTSGTLTWTLSLLLNNREVLNKVIHELDTQIGRGRMVEESDLKNLVYLQAIIKETLRLYLAGPLNLPHESMEDCIVDGYHVPAGTRLLTNISKIQRDPVLYPDPLEFRPERFLTTHMGIVTDWTLGLLAKGLAVEFEA